MYASTNNTVLSVDANTVLSVFLSHQQDAEATKGHGTESRRSLTSGAGKAQTFKAASFGERQHSTKAN